MITNNNHLRKSKLPLKKFIKNTTSSGNVGFLAFIDLSILLLIFVIISVKFSVINGYKIELPDNKYVIEYPASKFSITIVPDLNANQYNYYFNDKRLELDEVEVELSKELKKRQKIFTQNGIEQYHFTLSLKADKKTPYELVSAIFNLAEKYNINLITATKKH